MPFPYSFTFYSYKGGVGRSLALLNTAYVLASWGRHVLIVDMDLEAPGVGGLMTRLGELSPQPSRDLVDLLSLALTPSGEALPPVAEFIRSVLPEKLDSLKPKFGGVGRLDVLAPDPDRDYTARLATLALQNLERESIIDLGHRLHRHFKEQRFDLRPLGLEDFEEAVKTPYDYILIDSRTGFTEIGGLCVGPLADRLVVVTGLNDQNVSGTVHFLREVGIDLPPGEKRQPWDDADALAREADNVSLGPKPTIVVASPVPAGEIEFKRERLDVLEKKIGIKPLRVSYHPRLALMETIFVRDFDDEPPALDYRRLAEHLAAQVDDNADRLILDLVGSPARGALKPESAIRLPSQRPEAALIASALLFRDDVGPYYQRRIAAMLHDADTGRFAALIKWANALAKEGGARARHSADYFRRAFDRYSEATLINPASAEAFHNWGSALYDFASTVRGPQAVALLEQSVEKFARAVDLDPSSAPAFFGWGNALSSLAERTHSDEVERLFQQSFEKYSKAVQNSPGFAEAYTNWGLALAQCAAISDQATGGLFEQAFAKFSEALRAKPNFVPALINWAMALSKFALTLRAEDADRLFEQALEKCDEAVRLDPNSTAAYLHWGEILYDFAATRQGEEANALLGQALDKYERAARLGPESSRLLAGWGRTLMFAGSRSGGERAGHYFAEARQKLSRAGVDGLFDLACLDALQGDAASSVARLREALAEGIDFAGEFEEHKEFFAPIRDHPDFVAFLTQLPTYGNRGSIPNPGPSGTR